MCTVYVNATDPDGDHFGDALNLDLTNSSDASVPPGVYGLFVSDPGDAHGLSSYVYATIDEQQFDYHVADGKYRGGHGCQNTWLSADHTAQATYTTS